MKVFGQILKIKNITKNISFVVLLFVSFSCFSKSYFINKKVNASSFIASYKVDTTEYNLQWRIIPNSKIKNNNIINNSNGFRIICDNDSAAISFYTNIDSVKFIIKPKDTIYFNIILEKSELVLVKVIGYNKSENYSDTYIKENTNAITIDVPEVNELIKIILLLNQDELEHAIKSANSSYREVFASEYYSDVLAYFYKFRKEKIVNALYRFIENDSVTTEADNYLDIKRFSSLYMFDKENKIIRTRYYTVEAGNHYDMLEPFISSINDFADKTEFREFYKNHLDIYKESKERYMQLVPVNSIWNFTEKHFKNKVQHYKIIFSPLESFNYVTTSNYNKNLPFNQYTYYASTPIWEISDDASVIRQNYIRNSSRFFVAQLAQYMNDYYKNDTLTLDTIFKKKNNWAYINDFDNKNKFRPKDIFYNYISGALFNLYYEEELKGKLEDQEDLIFYNNLLKIDKFNAQFTVLYDKYGYKQFDMVLKNIKDWCAKQK